MTTERDELLAWLRAGRQHVLSTFDGLDDRDARRAVLPSGWSPIEAVHHLTVDVERYWLRSVVGGETGLVLGGDAGTWGVPPELTVGEVLEMYLWNADIADRAILARSLDDEPAVPRHSGAGGHAYRTVREIVLLVLVETATHAGHLDAARELIDGRQHLVL